LRRVADALIMPSECLKQLLVGARDLAQRLLAPLGLRPSRVIAGHKFFFDPATDIGLELWATGGFEKDAIAQCAKFIRPDGVVIDVGANIGVHTVHFAACAQFGQVVCFEPARSTFAYLLQNVGHLSNVIPLNIALSDSTGVQPFFVAIDNAYSGLKDTNRKAISRQELVACVKGDDFLLAMLRDRRVDLLKIDVEGLETEVLRGMRQFIETHKPVIFCEIFSGERSNLDPQATVEFCVSLGYEAFVLRDKHLSKAGTHSDSLYNYFFVPKNET
jgi:FkbM family methyltransferase